MKRVLITGANSYVGTSFEKYLSGNFSGQYIVDTIDMLDPSWREKVFSAYDVIYHVAGIAHSDTGKISVEKEKLYRSVNTDLTIEVAKKAKREGVSQFIFMSSAIIYGDSAPIGKTKIITKDTVPMPTNCYGDSKLQAENGILPLDDDSFKIVIIRSPMIYGKGCKGNFAILEKFAKKLPVFPYVKNERSMIYIGNLAEFIRLMIDNEERGIFWPQNEEYSNTSELVRKIAEASGKNICLLTGFGWILGILGLVTGMVNKAFGSLVYENEMSFYKNHYHLFGLNDSIEVTEGKQ